MGLSGPGTKRLPLNGIAALTVLLAACGGSSPVGGSPATTRSPTPTGPPTATGIATGDPNVSGTIKFTSVLCNWPGAGGEGIRIFAQPGGQPGAGVGLVILVQAHSVNVRAAIGSGATYAQREFNGTGVSGFDGARGATVDTTLTEDPAAGTHPGAVGALRSVSMTIGCANQQPGQASIKVSGVTPAGALDGPLTSPRVDCATYPQGKTAVVTALIRVGGRKVLIIVGASWAGISVATDGHFYTNPNPATGTVLNTGGHWSGDVTEQSSGTTLHVLGDATCGSSTAT